MSELSDLIPKLFTSVEAKNRYLVYYDHPLDLYFQFFPYCIDTYLPFTHLLLLCCDLIAVLGLDSIIGERRQAMEDCEHDWAISFANLLFEQGEAIGCLRDYRVFLDPFLCYLR